MIHTHIYVVIHIHIYVVIHKCICGVVKVYEEIAQHFSETRHSGWPRVLEFLDLLPDGSVVADVGCGNGKYLGVNKTLFMVSFYGFWVKFLFQSIVFLGQFIYYFLT